MATKPRTEPVAPDPDARVKVRMLRWIRYAEDGRQMQRDLTVGSVHEVSRAVAGRWWLAEYAALVEGEVPFAPAELTKYLCGAIDDLGRLDERIPAVRRRLERMETLTRPAGPGGDAA